MENKREYRMYGLVTYNISPIQQGIQFGHAVVEYSNENFYEADYQQWAKEDKTFIILNGGTTNNTPTKLGSLNIHADALDEYVITARFHEPDLGDQLTAVVFLVDDRVWDKATWPDWNPEEISKSKWLKKFSAKKKEAETIVFLRDYLKKFRLA